MESSTSWGSETAIQHFLIELLHLSVAHLLVIIEQYVVAVEVLHSLSKQ